MRNLREHLALARDAVGHDDIEGGNAVAGDEQQAVAEVEDFADFAAAEFFDAGQIELQNWFVSMRGKILSPKSKVQSPKWHCGDDVRSLKLFGLKLGQV